MYAVHMQKRSMIAFLTQPHDSLLLHAVLHCFVAYAVHTVYAQYNGEAAGAGDLTRFCIILKSGVICRQ